MTATPQPPPCRPPRRRLHWSLLGSLMIIVLTLGVTISHAVDCPECWEPNPDYDPNNPFMSEEPCVPKDNPCEGYEDWEDLDLGKICGICTPLISARDLGACRLPQCPGCEQDTHITRIDQSRECDPIPWEEVLQELDNRALAGCAAALIACMRARDPISIEQCIVDAGVCVCTIANIRCGDCQFGARISYWETQGCVNQ